MTIVDTTERIVEIVVEDSQLSLAIGKKGQNVRLAAKLTGWRIDIKSEDEKRREVEAQFEGLEDGEEGATLTLPGLDDAQLVKLSDAGLDTADRLLETSVLNLATIAEVDEETAVELQNAIREQVAAAEQAAAEIAETNIGEGDATSSVNSPDSQAQGTTVPEEDNSAEKEPPIVVSDKEEPSPVEAGDDPSETDTDSKT